MDRPLVIINSLEEITDSKGIIYTWNGYSENQTRKSILKFVENSGDRLKCKYLEYIHDIAEFEYNNLKIREHLELKSGLSLWWMSLMAEKNPWKSPEITDCIRLIAIEEIIRKYSNKEVILSVNNKDLAKALGEMCSKLGIKFFWHPRKNNYFKNIICNDRILSFYSKILGFSYLFYYFISRWSFKEKINKNEILENETVFFSSYFYNLDKNMAENGDYYSRQWGKLPQYINDCGHKTFHLENFVRSPDISSPNYAKKLLKSLNTRRVNRNHVFLDEHLSFRMLRIVFFEYLKLLFTSIDYLKIKEAFDLKRTDLNLWELTKRDWFSSTVGKVAVSNLILIYLFESHLNKISFQKIGFYLCENMGWERALIHAWQNNNHGRLIAVPHATIRFWDLRYFSDKRINMNSDIYSIPVPNNYALNGEEALKFFLENKYPKSKILKSEALRYQFLDNHIPKYGNNLINNIQNNNKSKKLLVVGDMSERQTNLMLNELEFLIKNYSFKADITIKPHPVSKIIESNFPLLNLSITHEPLQDITENFDIVFSSNSTSAGVDCFLMGKKVIIYLDHNTLNFSPLRGIDGITFVSNSNELYTELNSQTTSLHKSNIQEFFWIDKDLPKWKNILDKFI